MADILEANSRTEYNNGLHFYEQDIVLLDYVYSGDFVMDIKNINQIEDVSAYAKFLDGTTQYKDKDDLSSYWGFKWQK